MRIVQGLPNLIGITITWNLPFRSFSKVSDGSSIGSGTTIENRSKSDALPILS